MLKTILGNIVFLFLYAITHSVALASSLTDNPIQAEIHVQDGFKVECVYTVPREQGSWVSLTIDNMGRFIASDQLGILYRITLAEGKQAAVERILAYVKDEDNKPIGDPIGSAQGLLWAFDSLYVVVNSKGVPGSGLYRLKSTPGSDRLENAELLAPLGGGGEHGPHGITLGPDGKSLYIAAGNDCGLPKCGKNNVSLAWGGDQLLSPQTQSWDWHSKNGVVPGGWVCRTDLDGKDWQIVCAGFRNHYRLAFNQDGELFTSDGDNEWQIGLPWYRPPRICHVVSGADYGWRSNQRKLPTYFPDTVSHVATLPRGGPSGVVFGTGARFPEKYQRALFALDWAAGTIYAVHLQPSGSSYRGTVETFICGRPLAVTDALIGADGLLYFIIGGRDMQTCFYRVSYIGKESTAPADRTVDEAAKSARSLRRRLETFHGTRAPESIDAAWPHLQSPDPAIRYAARVTIEHQNVDGWQELVFNEKNPQAFLTAAMALARCGKRPIQDRLLSALQLVDWARLNNEQRIELLRDYSLTFIRMGKPDNRKLTDGIVQTLSAHYPTDSDWVDFELSRILVYLQAPGFVEQTLALLKAASTQERQMHFGYMLRFAKDTWTPSQRTEYLEWRMRAQSLGGGREVRDLLVELQNSCIEVAPVDEKQNLSKILQKLDAIPPIQPQKFVNKWSTNELLPLLNVDLSQRDLTNGRNIYHAASCIKCHYMHTEGTEIGPDLSLIGSRLDRGSILESILEPNKVNVDMYALQNIKMSDGKQFTARVLCETNGKYQIVMDPLTPGQYVDINKCDVISLKTATISIMPEGLLNNFNQNEILDLMAFLLDEKYGNALKNMKITKIPAMDIKQEEHRPSGEELKPKGDSPKGDQPGEAASGSGKGALKGVVKFDGDPPEPRVRKPSDTGDCKHEVSLEDLIVDKPTKGIRYAIIRILNVKSPEPPAPLKQLSTIDQSGCKFSPHVIIIPPGADVSFLNPDKVAHNVHTNPLDGRNNAINTMMHANDEKLVLKGEKYFTEQELVQVRCDIHPWMKCYVVVHDPRFAAISGPDGAFEINGVPPGSYELIIYHELLGEKRMKIEISESNTTNVGEIKFKK